MDDAQGAVPRNERMSSVALAAVRNRVACARRSRTSSARMTPRLSAPAAAARTYGLGLSAENCSCAILQRLAS